MIKHWFFVLSFLGLLISPALLKAQTKACTKAEFKFSVPKVVLANVPFDFSINALGPKQEKLQSFFVSGQLTLEDKKQNLAFQDGKLNVKQAQIANLGSSTITWQSDCFFAQSQVYVIPGILSLLPALIAILLALVFREVLIAIFCGIWFGASLVYQYNPGLGFLHALDTYIAGSLADKNHATIIIFTLTLGGMVGIISKAGGTHGIVQKLKQYATNPRGGQIAAWAMGLFIFFDDYANTLIVGNTMRPLTDRLKISREKLSFVVDATAAPVVSIALISSWVGFQVGLIEQAFKNLEIQQDAYLSFIRSIPFSSYSILMLAFVFLLAWLRRDYGSMYKAEYRARSTGKVLSDSAQPLVDDKSLDIEPEENVPLRWYNAAIPIAVVIITTLIGLYIDGCANLPAQASKSTLAHIFGAADSFNVLLWSSTLGALTAAVLAISQRILSVKTTIHAWSSGIKSMIIAIIILILAWAIGKICHDLNTADYVIHISQGLFSANFLPLFTFWVSAIIAFSTGTSWATMAILTPIVVPLTYKMTLLTGMDAELSHSILLGTIGAVLSGSVFGDHCSPISDTTIMSSMTSAADHIDHVRTQLPYALTVAFLASIVGYLPAGFGFPSWLSLLLGVVFVLAWIRIWGRKVPIPED